MKINYILILIAFSAAMHQAQFKSALEKKVLLNQNSWFSQQTSQPTIDRYSNLVPDQNQSSFIDSIKTLPKDSMKYNMYGDLRDDNPLYNPKSSIGMVILRVTLANASTLAIDRYVFNYDFSRVGFNTWHNNIKTGWEWDQDRFGMNYFFHPFSGSMYFNGARANGYSFYESIPFAFLGSLEWEYLGENTLPSYNDFINTPINGTFLGEIFYRFGSNILDDQTTGFERFIREAFVALMTPTRFISRLLHGEVTRVTSEEVYQKEPMNVTFAGGFHRVNLGTAIENTGTNSLNLNLTVAYGNPFEKRSRKPFDYFHVTGDLDFGVGRKIVDLATGYGILFGSNIQTGNLEMLVGLFQHMNFFDNNTFELGSIGIGPSIISKLLVSKNSSLYTNLHVALVPFGALSNRFGITDTSQVRDYSYDGGAETKIECIYNVNRWLGLAFTGYYWWFHTLVGVSGNSYIGLIKPSITFKIFNNWSIGFEHLIYYSDRYPTDFASVHSVRTEQKIFLQFCLEEFEFKK